MGKIRILDEVTINKIAAGEVIERPSSVVKELIENSIDAGASDIKIEVIKSGKKLIRVIDNGSGMSREDASLSFLKHATSKITKVEDIETVRTMGFRGEALSSICAVSKVEIITKTKEELSGTKITVHGGKLMGIVEIGAPAGTTVLVEELFYNTPARKKYLKSDSTELAHIVDVVTSNALGHNNVSFTLLNNGNEILSSPASSLQDAIIHIYGSEAARAMLPVYFENELAKVAGYVSKPSLTRGSLNFQSFFINDRSISSRAISYALRDAYGTLLPKDRFPVAVLKIYVDTKEVDVNVHPTKNQVRLSHEREICALVNQAVKASLMQGSLVSEVTPKQALLYEAPLEMPLVKETGTGFKASVKDTERRLRQTEKFAEEKKTEPPEFKVLGQIEGMYIIADTKDGLVIIDQHAAHERVFFENVRDSKREDAQELLVPVNLELDSREKVLMKECIPFLEEFGFKIAEFGPNSFAVVAVPRVLGKLEDPVFIHDIINDILSEGRIKDETGIFDRVTKTIACRSAIKAGADFSASQMETLVEQLLKTENPYTCPHGRPTMVSFNRQELDKLFKRG